MFLSKVNKEGKTGFVVSKATGASYKVKLIYKSSLNTKMDVFMICGGNVVWRDSLRRRYSVK